MLSFAVRAWFAPSELPNIRSSLPLRSNHASVLHGSPFRLWPPCPVFGFFIKVIKAQSRQIVFRRRQEQAINVGAYARGYCFAAEVRDANNRGLSTFWRATGEWPRVIPLLPRRERRR